MPLTPKETTNLLKKLGHRPKKKLGQNFLIDGNIVQKSLDMADLPPHLPIVEIGPGLGTLTKRLLEAGHPVHAVEIDRALFENLESSLAPFVKSKQLNLTHGDGVKEPIGSLPENVEDYAVVANLPYAISSPWLEALLATARLPIRMVLMLQREAVDRMTSAPAQSQPLQLSQSARGADAMARLTAFENLARAIGERPVEPPVRQVEQAGSSPSGGTTDGSQSSSQQGTDQQRPFPNQTQPYPDLAAVSDVWRTQSLKTENTGERMAEQAQGSAAAEGESGDTRAKEGQPKSAFRPGDVYSELTLLRARICGDCGFRTSSSGRCARCGFELMQANKPIQPA